MTSEIIKVLYVDDEEENLIAFRASFRRKFEIFTATSAEEGYKILDLNLIPIIISDNRMPKETGIEFLSNIRKKFPDSIRILITGYSHIGSVISAINKGGVSFYLSKPWQDEGFEESIRQGYAWYKLKRDKEYQITSLTEEVLELKERINYEFEHYTIFIEDSLVTAIKQYLVFFKEFVSQSKNQKIHFEVKSAPLGIEIELSKNENKELIQNYLNEYMGFITEGKNFSPILVNHDAIQNEILLAKMGFEKRHLENSIELEKIKNTVLTDALLRLHDVTRNPNPNSFNLNFNPNIVIENKLANEKAKQEEKIVQNNPWISGTFYLFAVIIILTTLMIGSDKLNIVALPVIVISGLIIFSLIGVFQLRNDKNLEDKSFLELIGMTFQLIPLIRKNNKVDNN